MQLSIIIPTLRQGTYLDDLLKNLMKLQLQSFEIIIIENKLVNEAWNEGIKKAKGKYILVVNDDIILYD